MMKYITVCFIQLWIVQISLACSCTSHQADFYKNLREDLTICYGVVDSVTYKLFSNGVRPGLANLSIIPNTSEKLVVAGQDGINCGESMRNFKMGDTVIFALAGGFNVYGQDTFYLEGCRGRYYLKIENGMNDGLTTQQIFTKIHNIITGITDFEITRKIEINPNPASNFILLNYGMNHDATVETEILDANGKMVKRINKPASLSAGNYVKEVDVTDLKSGVYFVKITTNSSSVLRKLVVQ